MLEGLATCQRCGGIADGYAVVPGWFVQEVRARMGIPDDEPQPLRIEAMQPPLCDACARVLAEPTTEARRWWIDTLGREADILDDTPGM